MPNQEKLLPYALTTPERVKDLIDKDGTDLDPIIIRIINAATDYFQGQIGRSLLRATYTNEVYSVYGARQKILALRNIPVYSISSLQYRAGTPSTPNWTNFIADQYELIDPQPDAAGITSYPSGIVRVYGVMPRLYNNMVRATYAAGYLIDFSNAGDITKHTLPADVSRCVENICVRWIKRRDFAGKNAETLVNATINFKDALDSEDKDVISRFRAPTLT